MNRLAKHISGRLFYIIAGGLFVLFLLLPFVMIFMEALGKQWFGAEMFPPMWTLDWFRWATRTVDLAQVISNTVYIAILATIISLLLAFPAAWGLTRSKLKLKYFIISLILLPRMIPEITFALGVAKVFYFVNLNNTYLGIALAHVILAAPFSVLVLLPAFESLDRRIIEAAEVMGCKPTQLFGRVLIPMAMPGILSAALFSFLTSYNDFVLTLMLYGSNTVTLTVQTYNSIGNGYVPIASAISVILLFPSLVFLALISRWMKPEKLIGGIKGS